MSGHTKPTVLVTRSLVDATATARLAEVADVREWTNDHAIDRESLLNLVRGCGGVLSMLTDRIDGDILDASKDLLVVSNMAVGVDNIDLAACAERGIAVGHTPDVLTDTTADTAWMLLLATSRRMVEGLDSVREGRWGPWAPDELLGRDASGTTLGVVGMGRIGMAVARRAAGFGMDVIYSSRSAKPAAAALGYHHRDLTSLLGSSDHVVVAVDLNADTRGMIGEAELAAMKPSASLINIARGPIVQTDALVDALSAGIIRCAGLDVTDPEPLPPDHPLVELPNCTVIPHMGSSTWRTRIAMTNLAVDNLIAGIAGEPLPHGVAAR